jgi:iron complex outermembrane recepter protein
VIEDEKNTTYEVGLKYTMFDSRATLNLAGYWTVVEDYQANVVSSLETAAIRSYPANIPEVRVRGVEADFAALLFTGFTVRASAAYADGENTDYPAGPCPLEVQTAATVACDLTGVPLAGLSDWAGTLGFDYALPLGTGVFLLHADSNWPMPASATASRTLGKSLSSPAISSTPTTSRHSRSRPEIPVSSWGSPAIREWSV